MTKVIPQPKRSDYATRKEYRWAKKVAKREQQRQLMPVLIAIPVGAAVIALLTQSFMVFLLLVLIGGPLIGLALGVVAALKQR